MGTPREYGFNDISKENILKADPLSLFCSHPHSQWPLLAGKLFSVTEKGGHNTSSKRLVLEADPTTLTYSCASLCQDSCIMCGWRLDAIHSPGVHRYCRCAGMPGLSPVSICLSQSFCFSITDKGHTAFILKQIRSWGCCNSHMFSWLLDLRTE